MEILNNIDWTLDRNGFDTSVLTGKLLVVYKVDISNDLYYGTSKEGQMQKVYEKCKQQIKTNISRVVFDEVIDMLRIEGNAMVQSSFKCTDYRNSETMRECARRLLLMASKMEVPE